MASSLKELSVTIATSSNARQFGVTVTPQLVEEIQKISNRSKAFNGVGQFEGQPQSELYPERININPSVFNYARRIDQNRVIIGLAGSQLNRFSTQTVNMFNEVIAGGGHSSSIVSGEGGF